MVKMRPKILKLLFVLSLLGLIGGCAKESLDKEIDKLGRATGPVNKSAWQTERLKGATGKVHEGKVLKTIDVPNYTYIKLSTDLKKELWTAVPSTKVENGQSVKVIESLVMKDFESPTLKRKFDSVVFGILDMNSAKSPVPKDAGTQAPVLPPGHPLINKAAN